MVAGVAGVPLYYLVQSLGQQFVERRKLLNVDFLQRVGGANLVHDVTDRVVDPQGLVIRAIVAQRVHHQMPTDLIHDF